MGTEIRLALSIHSFIWLHFCVICLKVTEDIVSCSISFKALQKSLQSLYTDGSRWILETLILSSRPTPRSPWHHGGHGLVRLNTLHVHPGTTVAMAWYDWTRASILFHFAWESAGGVLISSNSHNFCPTFYFNVYMLTPKSILSPSMAVNAIFLFMYGGVSVAQQYPTRL